MYYSSAVIAYYYTAERRGRAVCTQRGRGHLIEGTYPNAMNVRYSIILYMQGRHSTIAERGPLLYTRPAESKIKSVC